MRALYRYICVFIMLLLCVSCSLYSPGKDEPYAMYGAYPAGSVQLGVISHVGETELVSTPGNENTLYGAGMGAAAGGLITLGQPIGVIGGGLAGGAVIGTLLGDDYTPAPVRAKALLISVDLDNGQLVTVAQPEDDVYLPGDRVRVVYEAERVYVRLDRP